LAGRDDRLGAKHFAGMGHDPGSKVIVLTLVYMIVDLAKAATVDGHWSDRVSQDLRRHGIHAGEFWQIYRLVKSVTS
jgi:hypothetical protein